ncbi:winged helix-turn-helix domain-containing protein [Haladaptatus sp. YSMS36]|uniref:helix-turn-helix transcriptional regulator n=1 Tax=Haladaptatus sp. YSMS36 TaxID=3033384 RepID=UPI0023E8BFB0|nr:transcriptional regulator [Haladaptatus sp. YSMS36]
MDSAVEEIEFLARSAHRVGVLEALTTEPHDRGDLRQVTGASSPTMGRIIADFEERNWIHRAGRTYELTSLGAFVAEQFLTLRDAMETEHKLRDVWQWLPREMPGFSVELFADAVVSRPGPGYPYEPVARLTHLIENTERMWGFDTIVQKSINNEAVCDAVLGGMELEYVFSPTSLEGTYAWNPDRVRAVATSENCAVFVHDNLPDGDRCGLGIVDDRVGICCHDLDTGALVAIIDTDAPAARKWAISVYEQVRNEAKPVTPAQFEGPLEEAPF